MRTVSSSSLANPSLWVFCPPLQFIAQQVCTLTSYQVSTNHHQDVQQLIRSRFPPNSWSIMDLRGKSNSSSVRLYFSAYLFA
jgi:hypothetical protein